MRYRNIAILLIILLLPIVIFMVLKTGKTVVSELDYFGPSKRVEDDTLRYRVPMHKLVDTSQYTGQHLILHFIPHDSSALFTHAVANVHGIAQRLPEVENIKLISFTDPSSVTDTALQYNAFWHEIPLPSIDQTFIAKALLPGFEKSDQYATDQVLILVDKNFFIRGFYFAGNDKLDKELLGELRVLRLSYGEET